MTTEWLLSGHNTQESIALAPPLTASAIEANLNTAVGWTIETLAGDVSDFDPEIQPSTIVQGWVYINIHYATRNMARVLPFDAASVGVPAHLVAAHEKVAPARILRLPARYRRLYRWTREFYRQRLGVYTQEAQALYWQLRASANPLPLLWPLFEPDFVTRLVDDARAHGVVSITVAVLDGILRQRAPELLGLFAGRATATSLLGQHIWDLRQTAEQCGPEVVQLLRAGEAELATYAAVPAAAPLLAAIAAFQRQHGHRGFRYELDFAAERLADHTGHVLTALAAQLEVGQSPAQRAEALRTEGIAVLRGMNPVRRALWQRVLQWAQQLIAWREDSKSYTALHHALYGLAARVLSQQFYPALPDALFFYTFEEFLAFGRSQGKQQVARDILLRRCAEFELQVQQPPPPELLWYNPTTRYWHPVLAAAHPTVAPVSLSHFEGIAACKGREPVEGIALVTNDPTAAGRRLLELEGPVILVTRLTDPAWSSLFGRLTGVVTELGGLISHATIVARENGLPAIVGVPDITRHVRDGQRLRLDGELGVVEILG